MNGAWIRSWAVVAACGIAFAGARAATKIIESEASGRPAETRPRKILVLAVAADPAMRAAFEDVIAGELALQGANAVASHLSFPELPTERGPFEQKLVADGFDALTVSRLVGQKDKVKWVEGSASYRSEYLGSDWWGGYWHTYRQVSLPGYLEKETRVRVRTDLWRTSGKDGRLAWSGTSETLDPGTAFQAAREVGAALAKALAKARLI